MSLPKKLEHYIERQTNPSWERLGLKVFLTQFAASLLTLFICPQLGVQFFENFEGLRNWFMALGHSWCEFLCGSFYALCFWFIFRIIFSVFEQRKLMNELLISHTLIATGLFGFIIMWGLSLGLSTSEILVELHLAWLLGFLLIYGLNVLKNLSLFQKIKKYI